jgi:hypothetical protein
MNIVSLFYLAFVAVVALVYFIAPRRFRWVILLGASLVIYLYCGGKMIAWLLVTSLSIYLGGLMIDRRQKRYLEQLEASPELDKDSRRTLKKKSERDKRCCAALVAAVNIAIWVTFKFADMLIEKLRNE